ncbi:TetR/AcrR family transcriptional regulator [bacterium]|nr:MAG: TetR/AcrR family transcriptional regulator [bacterium]
MEAGTPHDDLRTRVIVAAIELLTKSGRDAVTTRGVAEAAGIQAPTIYRLFGDKEGLLGAIAEHGFVSYLKTKKVREEGGDPVENMRAGWDLHIEFGLSHPAIYLLMYANPRPGVKSPAAEISHCLLRSHIQRVAMVGRLLVNEEQAANLVHSAACGTVLTLLGMPAEQRDMRLSELARDSVLSSITTTAPAVESADYVTAAITLRASLSDAAPLSKGERTMMIEWLDRLASG